MIYLVRLCWACHSHKLPFADLTFRYLLHGSLCFGDIRSRINYDWWQTGWSLNIVAILAGCNNRVGCSHLLILMVWKKDMRLRNMLHCPSALWWGGTDLLAPNCARGGHVSGSPVRGRAAIAPFCIFLFQCFLYRKGLKNSFYSNPKT